MSMYYCELCDRLLDGDWVESYEWGDGEVCIDCHVEHTPEDWEDYHIDYDPVRPKGMKWAATHDAYDPTPWHSGGPPGDDRYFLGNSIADVYQQVIEYNEEQVEKERD